MNSFVLFFFCGLCICVEFKELLIFVVLIMIV